MVPLSTSRDSTQTVRSLEVSSSSMNGLSLTLTLTRSGVELLNRMEDVSISNICLLKMYLPVDC